MSARSSLHDSGSAPAPAWLDRSLYPFAGRLFDTADGRLHYLDVGEGPPVVLVHGTPTWSFLYRRLITRLAARHRVVAVDHLGFGLSDKPPRAPYTPQDHARRLGSLIDALHLSHVTMVVHDFGGPIGIAAALARRERVERLVLFNTWLWSIDDDPAIARGARVAGSWLGRLLYRHVNFSVNVLMPKAFGDRRLLTPHIHRHYRAPLASPDERMATWACARALRDAGPWFDALWMQRDRLRDLPMLLLWGLRDPAFGLPYLDRWRRELPHAELHALANVGHFVPEEAPDVTGALVERFVDTHASRERVTG
jgi:haloalkane dehalogenase